ncbi:MAG: MgtC/SapB family protein [Burkholderiaceae bacterium]
MATQLATPLWIGFAVACGAGLLIGVERERRKNDPTHVSIGGVRTFALAALAGALAQSLAMPALVIAGALLLGLLIGMSYYRNVAADAGLTSELALFVTYLIGVTAIALPGVAAGIAVVVTVLLAARTRLHRLSTDLMTQEELHDGLILAGAAAVVLPLLPDAPITWLAGLNPRSVWAIVVLLLVIQAAGHLALRLLGARQGVALAGLISGFVTSTGTIAAMGLNAKERPELASAYAVGAIASCAATFVQLFILVTVLHPAVVRMAGLICLAGLGAVVLTALPWLARGNAVPQPDVQPQMQQRRMFSLRDTIGFALLLATVTAVVAWINQSAGLTAAAATTALAGLADAHAAAASVLSMGAAGSMDARQTALLLLIALTSNTCSKLVASWTGGAPFAKRVMPALILIVLAAWLPWVLTQYGVR